jgi:hypothetical protein
MAERPPAPPPPPPPGPGGAYPAHSAGTRPSGFTGSAIFLLIVGILGLLYSLLILVGAGRVEDLLLEAGVAPSDVDAATSVLVGLGVVLLIVHALQVVGATMLFRGRGRGLAITTAVIGGVIWLMVLVLGLAQGTVDPIGLVMALAAIGCAITVPILVGRVRTSVQA